MSDSFLDHLPSHERQRLKKRMSAAAYERLRESVKGPEDLERELQRSEKIAEVHFAMESEPQIRDRVKAAVEAELQKGIEEVVEHDEKVSAETKEELLRGKFTVSTGPNRKGEDALLLCPEGNVHEKIAIKPSFSDRIASGLLQKNDR